jgi:dolichol-phosphate mannosyltransferase
MVKISVIIPLLNETLLIVELVNRVKINVEHISQDFEIILVDDGSNDNTWEKIVIEASKEKRIKGIKFSRNFGHHYAITAGLQSSLGDWVVVMDGDLQDRPEVIPQLYNKAQEGFDIVFVSRQNRPEKVHYIIAQKLFYWILNRSSGIKFDSSQANFSIISRKVVQSFNLFSEHSRFYASSIKWLGFKHTHVKANHGERLAGKPSYTLKKRFNLAFDIIISYSERPLKVPLALGVLYLVTFVVLSFVSYLNLFDVNFPSLDTLFFLTTALQFMSLGIIGTYVGRIFHETKNRPLYIIEKKVNC